jgi:hypothetical protein
LKWRKHFQTFLVPGISLLIPIFTFGQNHNLPLNQAFSLSWEQASIQTDKIVHTSFKPVLETEVARIGKEDSLLYPTLHLSSKREKSWLSRKLFHEHLISLDTGQVQLSIDPLFNFELGREMEKDTDPRKDISYYKNVRGFNIKLSIGSKVSFESSFRENQVVLPFFPNERALATEVAYGQGRWKEFGDNGYDFSMASSYINYAPSDRVNFQLGHGKHFLGEGHRSLLLSDLSFNYPYLRIGSNWFDRKLQYNNLYTLFQDLERLPSVNSEGLFERKQGVFHYLEFKPNTKWSVGLFEGLIFPSLDSSGNIGVGANYWVPLILLNTILEADKAKRNALLGLNASYVLWEKVKFYNQLLAYDGQFDDFSFQVGAKYFLSEQLMLQGEFNSQADRSGSNLFYHYNEPLNYPVQKELQEYIAIVQYQKNRWQSRLVANAFQEKGKVVNQLADFRQSYIVNPSYNFTISLGAQYSDIEVWEAKSLFVYFGLSTNLQNIYFNY